MRDYRRYGCYQRAYRLVLGVYRVTAGFPRGEQFGLVSQMRRAAASIPANIAEGAGRRSAADFARFLDIALGSANELEMFLDLAHDLGYLSENEHAELLLEVRAVEAALAALRRTLRGTNRERTAPAR